MGSNQTNTVSYCLLSICVLTMSSGIGVADDSGPLARSPADDARMKAVITFADNVLKHGLDRYGPKPTPLLVDGVNVDTLKPVEWIHGGETWIPSNLASHQNLFRTLIGLTTLTGDGRYRKAAMEATEYHIENLLRPCGMPQWGGHRFVDLKTGNIVGEQDAHELKCNYPYYEFMREINPQAAERIIKSIWNSHVLDWGTFDMNRHGRYGLPMGKLWENEFEGAEPFFKGAGLTFINCGSDLIYAGALLYRLTGDEGALVWSKRLAEQYVKARDPKTQLGAYQFSQVKRTREPTDDSSTSSIFGDRAKRQFGPEFGEVALEGRVLAPGHANSIYGRATTAQLHLAEMLGESGKEFLEWARTGLSAYAEHAYNPETNMLTAMFTDGTKITPEDVKRPGYYSPGTFRERPAGFPLLLSYALAHRLSGDDALWQTARSIAKAHGLGDFGEKPGQSVKINLNNNCNDPLALFAILEICNASDHPAYRELARKIGDNIVANRFHKGFFLPTSEHINASFDALEPLALLTLEAFLRGTPNAVPAYVGGRGYIHGPHDGLGRTTDSVAIWSKRREMSQD